MSLLYPDGIASFYVQGFVSAITYHLGYLRMKTWVLVSTVFVLLTIHLPYTSATSYGVTFTWRERKGGHDVG